jgi:DNA-binding CsgD family transcriptional regulator
MYPAQLEDITPRQWQVLRLLMRGARVFTIARELQISESTVRKHLESLFDKMGAHSQVELVERVRRITGEPAGRAIAVADPEAVRKTVEEADRHVLETVSAALNQSDPGPGLKQAVRDFLPLGQEGRAAWSARLVYWAALSQGVLDDRSGLDTELMQRTRELAEASKVRDQLPDGREPSEVVEELRRRLFAAAIRLVGDPSPKACAEQLAALDQHVDELIRRWRPGADA